MCVKIVGSEKVIFTIEVRTLSSRLPAKCFLPIQGLTFSEIIYARIKKLIPNAHIIVATTNDPSDNSLCNYLDNRGITFFRGSSNDVWKRIAEICKLFKPDCLVKITGDNPFVDPEQIIHSLDTFNKKETCDILYTYGTRYVPLGFDYEIVNPNKIVMLYNDNASDYDKEHATTLLKRVSSQTLQLISKTPLPDTAICNMELTIDTIEDYLFARNLFDHPSTLSVVESSMHDIAKECIRQDMWNTHPRKFNK